MFCISELCGQQALFDATHNRFLVQLTIACWHYTVALWHHPHSLVGATSSGSGLVASHNMLCSSFLFGSPALHVLKESVLTA
jgi:hypothetical protein